MNRIRFLLFDNRARSVSFLLFDFPPCKIFIIIVEVSERTFVSKFSAKHSKVECRDEVVIKTRKRKHLLRLELRACNASHIHVTRTHSASLSLPLTR